MDWSLLTQGTEGAKAPAALIEHAVVMTETVEVKYPYQKGIQAQPGIEV